MGTVALTSVERVRQRLAVEEDEKVDASIQSAMLATAPVFEARLSTPFIEASYEDKYNLSASLTTPLDGYVRLKTTAGFIQEDTVVVTSGYSLAEARIGVVIPSADLIISAEKGWVSVPEDYIGQYVVVVYDAGFSGVDSVPEWLQEAATNHAITVMSIHQMDDKNPELTTTLKTLNTEIDHLLNGHVRANVSALKPLR